MKEQTPVILRKDAALRLFRIRSGHPLRTGIVLHLLKPDAIIKGPMDTVRSRIIITGRNEMGIHPFDMFFRLKLNRRTECYRFDTRMEIAKTIKDDLLPVHELLLHYILQRRKHCKGVCLRRSTPPGNHVCQFRSMDYTTDTDSCKPLPVPGRVAVVNNLTQFIFYTHHL